MGAPPGWGGRWTAVNSLWTYIHRVLHLLGIASVDQEEVSLLSAPVIRIRHAHSPRGHVLAHHPSVQHPDEPFGWVSPHTLASPSSQDASFFLLHFDASDPQQPDRARIATAAPAFDSPRAWLAVDRHSGTLSLTVSERAATLFDVEPATACKRGGGGCGVAARSGAAAMVVLRADTNVGSYLTIAEGDRARVAAAEIHNAAPVFLDHVPLPPTLTAGAGLLQPPPADYTLATVYNSPRTAPVRLQSAARGWFVASKPACPLAAAGKNDAGWDAFELVYDCATRTALLRDARGLYVRFARDGADGHAPSSRRDSGGSSSSSGSSNGSVCACGDDEEAGFLIAGNPRRNNNACDNNNDNRAKGGAATKSTAAPAASDEEDAQHSEACSDGEARWVGARAAERFAVLAGSDGARDDTVVLKSRKGYISARRGGRVCLSRRVEAGAAERFHLRLAPPSANGLGRPRVRLGPNNGVHGAREVDGSVIVAAAADVVYEVLRDYEHFADFMSDASESQILEQSAPNRLSVRMVQCHSFLMLTIPMTLVLDVTEDKASGAVSMRLIRGLGIKQYSGTWRAVPRGDGKCLLRCTIAATPAVPAPGFLLDGLIMHATSASMAQVAAEAVRRSTAVVAARKRSQHARR